MGGDTEFTAASAYRFDCESNQWTRIGDMTAKRMSCHALASGNKLYVVGGYFGTQRCKTWTATTPPRTRGIVSPPCPTRSSPWPSSAPGSTCPSEVRSQPDKTWDLSPDHSISALRDHSEEVGGEARVYRRLCNKDQGVRT